MADATAMSQNTQQDKEQRDDQQHEYTNRLINETSPYLLQHAHNPVDWYPWGEEAFQAAREQDKPIFLSIGYSTCYWCHVMERESFENPEIAAVMNETCINIKVDREERPDVDDIYMTAVQLMTQSGGWPMSVFLEPEELKPFFGDTYFPPEQRGGRMAFPDLVRRVGEAWQNQRDALLQGADEIARAVKQSMAQSQQQHTLTAEMVDQGITQFLAGYDQTHGGFGGGPRRAPKFPTPVVLDFFLQAGWDNTQARQATLHTLNRMAIGGMYDQVGGGFHRYSTDRRWLVPHFEKMLYDNAQLASTYARAYELTSDPLYAEIVQQTLDYVLREMRDERGGFYSAQDAEVNAREGQNYLWTPQQMRDALTAAGLEDDVDFALTVYGLEEGTNFQDPHHPDEPPSNVLYLADRPEAVAERMEMSREAFVERLNRIDAVLLKARDQRDQPGTDDKVITSWNGLMIAGLADGGRVLDDKRYIQAAAEAADFILSEMRTGDGGLYRTYRVGKANIDAFLDDYAMLIHGLLALHEATGEQKWIDYAVELTEETDSRFLDAEFGGYFDTLADQSDLFVRSKSTYDGAMPCGMSIMINNLIALHQYTNNDTYRDRAAETLLAVSDVLSQVPSTMALGAKGLDRFLKHYSADLLAVEGSGGEQPQQIVTTELEAVSAMTGEDEAGIFNLSITVAEGFHINSNDPGADGLQPLDIALVGSDGLQLHVEYPEAARIDGPVGAMNVYSNSITIPLRITRAGEISGDPSLVITYQACDDARCLAPQQEIVKVPISR